MFKERFKKIWNDNVWGKVIAGIIIPILYALFKFFSIIIAGLYEKISFYEISINLKDIFLSNTSLPNWLLFIISILVITSLLIIFSRIKDIYKRKEKTNDPDVRELFNPLSIQDLPLFIYGKPRDFFTARLGKAFPGNRDQLKWYHKTKAVERLEIFLSQPLIFQTHEENTYTSPMWWFRAGKSSQIQNFARLNMSKCLMNNFDELIISKIAVFYDDLDYRHFIYVELEGDKPTGVHQYSKNEISDGIESRGYAIEEYGLLGKKFIKREEYEDGSAEINGKVIDASDALLRRRYLSSYNFIVTSHDSPFNSTRFDKESKILLNGLLTNSIDFNEFFDFMLGFKREDTKYRGIF